jgi:TPR repeat protein
MNARPAAFMLVFALATFVGWALLVDVDERPAERQIDVVAATHRPVVGDEAVPVRREPESAEEPRSEPPAAPDWTRSFHESTDDFALAGELASAALNGDGRAQYRLGGVLLRCEVYKRILAAYTEGTVAERVEFHLSNGTLAEQGRSEFRRGALRCARLVTEDPFGDYDLPQEARDFRYWDRKAVETGDPLALMNRAFRSATDHRRSDDADTERAFRDGLLSDVRRAVFAGDGAALYVLGGMFSHPSLAAVPDHGYSWIVAACESGYDCSNANPDVGAGCVERGTCEPGQTFLDILQRDLGAGKYGAIYANAQDIRYKISSNDWDGLQQYLQVKD